MSLSAIEIRGFVERVLRQTGRRVDVSSPFVDASLPDGSRLHVVIPDITKAHWSVNIRKFSQCLRRLGDLMGVGVLSLEAADYLGDAVGAGKSVLVESAHTPDGWHAEVTLSSVWSPPVVSEFFPDSLRIRVEARA